MWEMIGSIYTEQSHMENGLVRWLEHILALEHLLIRTSPTRYRRVSAKVGTDMPRPAKPSRLVIACSHKVQVPGVYGLCEYGAYFQGAKLPVQVFPATLSAIRIKGWYS